MSKYIEVDALKEQIRKTHGIRSLDYLLPIEKEMVDAIDNAPSIDIVHCRECKKDGTRRCPYKVAKWGYTDDDFCSCGEREGE